MMQLTTLASTAFWLTAIGVLAGCDAADSPPPRAAPPRSDAVREMTENELQNFLVAGWLSGEKVIDAYPPIFSADGSYYMQGLATIEGQYLVSGNTYCVYHSNYAEKLYCRNVFIGPEGLFESDPDPSTDIAAERGLREQAIAPMSDIKGEVAG